MREFIKELSFRRLIDSLKLTPKHRLVEFGGNLFHNSFDFIIQMSFLPFRHMG